MRMLTELLALATVESAHAVGWSIDSLEAQAFAYLAVRSLGGLPAHISWHHRCTADPGTSHTWCAKIPIHDSIHWMLVSSR
jgi:1,6-anhydro-N-acetylmuramate kinase